MRRRGFTFIELSVVIVLLALFAVAVVPNVASAVEGGNRRAFRHSVLTLIHEARVTAVQSGQTVALTHTDDGFQLAATVDDQESVIRSVATAPGVEVSHFVREGMETGDADWLVNFYSDGTCDGGSFEFDEGANAQTVTISRRDGRIALTDGQYDEAGNPDQEWDAGGYVQAG